MKGMLFGVFVWLVSKIFVIGLVCFFRTGIDVRHLTRSSKFLTTAKHEEGGRSIASTLYVH